MPTFGYDPITGWTAAPYPLVLADLRSRYTAEAGANVDTINGPAADMLRTVSSAMTDAWASQEGAYNAGFISAAPGTNGVAEGSSLENLLTPRIGPKLAAVASTVVLPLAAAAGPDINVPAGHSVVLTGESTPWVLVEPAVIPGGGTVNALFRYTLTGPRRVVAGSTWEILTPVTGWTGAGPNVDAAITGRDVETDAEYRSRYRAALRNNIAAEVRAVDGVSSAAIIEHPWGYPDAFWGTTHWLELLVVGGSNAAVAAAIQRTRAKGTTTVGNVSVALPEPDYVDGEVVIRFSRPDLIRVYVSVVITKGEDYPTATSTAAIAARELAIKTAVVEYGNSLRAGQDSSGFKVASYIDSNAGIPGIDSISVAIDTADPPVNTGTLAAATREQLTIALVDIDVSGA